MLSAAPAFADDYTDLLNILQAKGSLTHSEYTSLMAKHMHGARGPRGRRSTQTTTTTTESEESMSDAHRDALAAAASAAAAQAALQKGQMMMTEMQNSPDIVHAEPYKLGSGVTIRIGSVDLKLLRHRQRILHLQQRGPWSRHGCRRRPRRCERLRLVSNPQRPAAGRLHRIRQHHAGRHRRRRSVRRLSRHQLGLGRSAEREQWRHVHCPRHSRRRLS